MRKFVLILAVLAIFSLGIIYGQEVYSADTGRNNQEVDAAKSGESKDGLSKNPGQNQEESKKEEEKEEEGKEEKKEEEEEKVDNSSERKSVQASSSKQSIKEDSPKKDTGSKTSTKVEKPAKEKKASKNSDDKAVEKAEKVDGSPVIDWANANSGSFRAKYLSDKKLKVMVVKGSDRYTYDLKGDNKYQSYPLQLGDGTYKVSIMENIGGSEYKFVLSKDVEIKTTNPNAKYLTSVQMIHWNDSMAAIKQAKSLASGKNDEQKVQAIYNFVVNHIKYDSSITSLPSGYVPSINSTYSNKKGICYDFASIFAGMLRSVDVPAKLVKGTATNVEGYHAWNEVYVNGSWRIVDTSYDSQLRAAGHSVNLYKSGSHYSKSSQY